MNPFDWFMLATGALGVLFVARGIGGIIKPK
jgi:hypothetical protein